MKHTIAASFTVEADDELEARQILQDFLSAALVGEPGPIDDYSVDEILESYSHESRRD